MSQGENKTVPRISFESKAGWSLSLLIHAGLLATVATGYSFFAARLGSGHRAGSVASRPMRCRMSLVSDNDPRPLLQLNGVQSAVALESQIVERVHAPHGIPLPDAKIPDRVTPISYQSPLTAAMRRQHEQ